MDELVSIIIPCYNQSRFLKSAVESCLQQNHAEKEIIIVDDGSRDNVADAIKPFKDEIKLIAQSNLGLSAARNTGIANSHGEFIQLLDADDILGADSIGIQLKFLTDNPDAKISVCRNKLFDKIAPDGQPHITGEWRLHRGSLDVYLCYFNIAPPHAFFTRREVINATGGFDTALRACEDYDYWLRAAFLGFMPYYNQEGIVYYRKHAQSMSANMKNQTRHDCLLHMKVAKLLQDNPEFPKGHRVDGVLGFTAGALETVDRLEDLNLEGSGALLGLVLEELENVRNVAGKQENRWNCLTSRFYFKILRILKGGNLKGQCRRNEIFELLEEIVARTLGSRSRVKLLATLVGNYFKRGGEHVFLKYWII